MIVLRFIWLYFMLTLPLWFCFVMGVVVAIEEKVKK